MIVCVCNQISDREIKRCVSAGMSFNDIQLELGVATCCGSCETCATELVDRHSDVVTKTRISVPTGHPTTVQQPAVALL